MIKLKRNNNWYKYLELNKLVLYDFTWKWWIWWKNILDWKDTIFWWLKNKYLKTFNLTDPLEKQLSRINGFYKVLSSVYNDRIQILYDSVYYDEKERVKEAKKIYEESEGRNEMILLEWEWDGMEESAYNVYYDVIEDIIWYRYNDMDIKEEEKIIWELSRREFNLLMQIYFWVYDDEKIKKELEEKEKKWEYEDIESLIDKEKFIKENWKRIEEYNKKLTEEMRKKQSRDYSRYSSIDKEFNKILSSNLKMEDYLKLQLIKKPTEWAFPELNIRKINDKNWDEEEQRKVVEKINKELWEEVVVLE